METTNPVIINCQSASVKLSSGKIFEFPIVDNKNLFAHFFRTKSDFRVEVHCSFMEETKYAMYKRKENVAYLVCAWEKKSEINEEAMQEITLNPKLSYLLN